MTRLTPTDNRQLYCVQAARKANGFLESEVERLRGEAELKEKSRNELELALSDVRSKTQVCFMCVTFQSRIPD